jgi:hypothetical protein
LLRPHRSQASRLPSLRLPRSQELPLRCTRLLFNPEIPSGSWHSETSAAGRAGRNCWRQTPESWTRRASSPARKS